MTCLAWQRMADGRGESNIYLACVAPATTCSLLTAAVEDFEPNGPKENFARISSSILTSTCEIAFSIGCIDLSVNIEEKMAFPTLDLENT